MLRLSVSGCVVTGLVWAAIACSPPVTQESGSEAIAESVTYNFTIDVTAGPLADNTYEGSFTYDPASIAGEGTEEIGVDDGLTASINFYGEDFSEADDSDYPDYPKLVFEDGEVVLLDFWVEEGDRIVWWNAPGWEVTLSEQ